MIVLSYYQTRPLLAARQQGQTSASISPDLGLTAVEVSLDADGVGFPSGETLAWEDVRRICCNEKQCFLLEGQAIRPIHVYSEAPVPVTVERSMPCSVAMRRTSGEL